MSETAAHENWSSRLGFLMASIGAAVGLGNLWKFPYILGQSGGSAFVADRHLPIKARAVADVTAGAAFHLDTQPQGILIVVDSQLDDLLRQAAGGAFVPEALSASAPVDGLAEVDGAAQ